MLNNEYFRIYNESLDVIYDSLSDLLKEKEPFIEHYTLYNHKKITDYMLFVRDFYKKSKQNDVPQNIQNKSKYIAHLWKNLNEVERKEYKDKATAMLDFFKKTYKKEKKKIYKKEKKIEENVQILFIDNNKRNNILNKIKIENIEYYIDWNNNLIDIENHEYIGYLDKGIIINFF
tara:strand:+ start:3009 stop:3533 length:525 start_codon:yes stop_codon:yes gene_type:complete